MKLEFGIEKNSEVGVRKSEERKQNSEKRKRNSEVGVMNSEVGMRKSEVGMRKLKCGMRPPASPSCRLYEPEAVGDRGAYAPEGMGKVD